MRLRKRVTMSQKRVEGALIQQILETLESRQLLSAGSPVIHPLMEMAPAAISADFQGYTPAQIRHAYGFDQLNADGSGQTIAIVTAFNDPNIAADLHTFDQKFGISDPPNLSVVSQTGGSVSSLRQDSGWASETALDVEWAHAIAPGANILLVEAKSDTLPDLAAAVNYARHAPGVSVVSMSWGGGEFYNELQYDKLFTTPSGHNGVSFVAASGDSGSWWGPSWPATSPNVLAVGGTSLFTSDSAGTYGTEYGWSYSGGGVSSYENTPSYQAAAQGTGARTSPDVSYDANPNTGFAMYSSVSDQGIKGWSVVGGTSAGTPQWAALIALANQVRAAEGKGSLDGATGTLPTLYGLYSAPGSTGYTTYASYVHDVTRGASSYFLASHSGYDGVTGLGSPKAPQVVAALAGMPEPAATTTTTVATHKASTSKRTLRRAVIVQASPSAEDTASTTVSTTATPVAAASAVAHGAQSHIAQGLANAASAEIVAASSILPAGVTGSPGRLFPAVFEAQATPFSSQPIIQPITKTVSGAVAGVADLARQPQVVADALTEVVGIAEASTAVIAQVAVPIVPRIGSLNALTAFADVIASFTHESAGVGTVLAASDHHALAWAVTFTVLVTDAVLVGYWWSNRRSKRSARRGFEQSPFCIRHVGH